jgi:hypothetical protein
MINLLNIGSLVLGLIAWSLPFVMLLRYKQNNSDNWIAFSVLSFSACALSLCFQIFYSYHLVKIEDWSALMDTTGPVTLAAAVLLIVTIILNTASAMIVFRGRMAK